MSNPSSYHAVVVDNRTQRIVRFGQDMSIQDGSHVSFVQAKDPATQQLAEYIMVMTPSGSHKVKVTGLHTPPDTGGATTLTDPNHQFPMVVDPNIHRVLNLGKDISGEPGTSVVFNNTAPEGSPQKIQMTLTPHDGPPTTVPTNGKVPPNTGA
jgi:hypothetical protein